MTTSTAITCAPPCERRDADAAGATGRDVRERVTATVAEIVEAASAEIDPDTPLALYGLDSLRSLELVAASFSGAGHPRLPLGMPRGESRGERVAGAADARTFRLCAYDWELATLGAPQRDLAELLCFVLPEDVSREEAGAFIERHRRALR